MSDKIVISYAYRGFTYLPLFLAHDLGYFPHGVELAYADGDEQALRSVLHLPNSRDTKSDFAICDPLVIGNLAALIGLREVGEPHIPVVVGSLIRRTPIWLFNTNQRIPPVATEAGLQHQVAKVRCYQSPNTGYIIGRRLLDKLGLPHDASHLAEVAFDHEFDATCGDNEVIVTSDIIKMGELGYNNNNIVFSYASKPTDIKEIFFTGIITRESIFLSDLPLVLAILAGLKKAIERITGEDIDKVAALAFASLKKKMTEQSFSPFTTTDETAQRRIVKAAIETIIRQESLYAPNLEVRKEDWDKSIAMRRAVIPDWAPPAYEAFTQDIPVILIQSGWKSHIVKRETAQIPAQSTPPIPVLNWHHRWTPTIGLLANLGLLIYLAWEVRDALTKATGDNHNKNALLSVLLGGSLLAGYAVFLYLSRRIWNRNIDKYGELVSFWLAFIVAAAGVAQLLKYGTGN